MDSSIASAIQMVNTQSSQSVVVRRCSRRTSAGRGMSRCPIQPVWGTFRLRLPRDSMTGIQCPVAGAERPNQIVHLVLMPMPKKPRRRSTPLPELPSERSLRYESPRGSLKALATRICAGGISCLPYDVNRRGGPVWVSPLHREPCHSLRSARQSAGNTQWNRTPKH